MDAVAALVPPVSVALLFVFAVRTMLHADRREREAMNRLERQERADAERRG